MSGLFEVLRNGALALLILAGLLLLIAALLAPPKLVFLSLSEDADVRFEGMPIAPSSRGAKFLYMGQSRLYVSSSDFEPVEIHFDREANVFRGDVEVSKWLGFIFLIDVALYEKDKNLRMNRYQGVLTAEGEQPPQILPLHPDYRGTHQPFDVVKRRYENKTGKSIHTMRYLQLVSSPDGGVYLDFETADGVAVEYIPPPDWPAGNLLMRVLYSMQEPPNDGYQPQLLVHQDQFLTPYDMGSTFFHCRFAGYFCAGRAAVFQNSRGAYEASVEIWHNAVQGDPRLRYD